MSTGHAKTKRDLFNFKGLTENTVAPVPPKDKKKKDERIPFYIRALDRLSTNLNPAATEDDVVVNTGTGNTVETIFDKNEIIYDDDLKLPEDGQVVQSKQPSEGSYKSIWQKPKIRPNMDFEEEMDPDEEFDFDDEELDCAIKAPPVRIIQSRPFYRQEQPDTQPSSIPEETPEESLEDALKASAVPEEEEPVGEKTYVPGPAGEYVEVVDELQDTIRKMSKPLMRNIELLNIPLTAKEATEIHKSISDLHYIKEERITNEPINEV